MDGILIIATAGILTSLLIKKSKGSTFWEYAIGSISWTLLSVYTTKTDYFPLSIFAIFISARYLVLFYVLRNREKIGVAQKSVKFLRRV